VDREATIHGVRIHARVSFHQDQNNAEVRVFDWSPQTSPGAMVTKTLRFDCNSSFKLNCRKGPASWGNLLTSLLLGACNLRCSLFHHPESI